jgi:hypothetical protein
MPKGVSDVLRDHVFASLTVPFRNGDKRQQVRRNAAYGRPNCGSAVREVQAFFLASVSALIMTRSLALLHDGDIFRLRCIRMIELANLRLLRSAGGDIMVGAPE